MVGEPEIMTGANDRGTPQIGFHEKFPGGFSLMWENAVEFTKIGVWRWLNHRFSA
jgi:hypothetical protein